MYLASQYASSNSGYVITILSGFATALVVVLAAEFFLRRREDKQRWADMNAGMIGQTEALNLLVQRVADYRIPTMQKDVTDLQTATANLRQAVRTMGGIVEG